jgi:hypothetical protein
MLRGRRSAFRAAVSGHEGVLFSSALAGACLAGLVACDVPPLASPAPTIDAVAPTPVVVATAAAPRPLAIAVAVGSPTPTPELVGDYPTLMRPRLQTVQQDFGQLDRQLASAKQAPMRMAEDDWRAETENVLGDLLSASADMRALGNRLTAPQNALNPRVLKLADDVDFVANEFNMAFNYDPDASHFIRAGRAEKTTIDELDSLLQDMH